MRPSTLLESVLARKWRCILEGLEGWAVVVAVVAVVAVDDEDDEDEEDDEDDEDDEEEDEDTECTGVARETPSAGVVVESLLADALWASITSETHATIKW